MSDDNLDPELEKTLEEHIRWVRQATELAISEGATGIKRAIDALEDEQLRGMIFVLVSERAGAPTGPRVRVAADRDNRIYQSWLRDAPRRATAGRRAATGGPAAQKQAGEEVADLVSCSPASAGAM